MKSRKSLLEKQNFNPTFKELLTVFSDRLDDRCGTEHDVESLKAFLKEIGFEVNDDDVYNDLEDNKAIEVTRHIIYFVT